MVRGFATLLLAIGPGEGRFVCFVRSDSLFPGPFERRADEGLEHRFRRGIYGERRAPTFDVEAGERLLGIRVLAGAGPGVIDEGGEELADQLEMLEAPARCAVSGEEPLRLHRRQRVE